MVESIYTIPLTEALDKDCDCAFCYLEDKLEREQIEYTLGPAMMEPDFRILCNEKGFCRRHIAQMAKAKRALPLALVLDTRCDEIIKKLKSADPHGVKKGFFAKKKSKEFELQSITKDLNKSCIVCERIEKTMTKFINTFWYLYGKEPEFKDKFMSGRGVCLKHFRELVEGAVSQNSNKKETFIKELYDFEMKVLNREKEEIHGFTKQFDYRSDKEKWQVERDAHLRCASRLCGSFERE